MQGRGAASYFQEEIYLVQTSILERFEMRHNFDVMYIGKNVYENFVNTFLGIDGKSKDNLNFRLDLQVLGIRSTDGKCVRKHQMR